MKGHLDIEQLEKYKKSDLVKLAEELGVSTEGTVKEIAARCAQVEVDVPDEDSEEEIDQESNEAELVEVVAICKYNDLQEKRVVSKGEKLMVSPERAELLRSRGLAE